MSETMETMEAMQALLKDATPEQAMEALIQVLELVVPRAKDGWEEYCPEFSEPEWAESDDIGIWHSGQDNGEKHMAASVQNVILTAIGQG